MIQLNDSNYWQLGHWKKMKSSHLIISDPSYLVIELYIILKHSGEQIIIFCLFSCILSFSHLPIMSVHKRYYKVLWCWPSNTLTAAKTDHVPLMMRSLSCVQYTESKNSRDNFFLMPRILHFHKDKPIIHSACFYIAAMNDTEERESSAQLAREITGQCQPDLAFRFACVRTDKQRLYLTVISPQA